MNSYGALGERDEGRVTLDRTYVGTSTDDDLARRLCARRGHDRANRDIANAHDATRVGTRADDKLTRSRIGRGTCGSVCRDEMDARTDRDVLCCGDGSRVNAVAAG